MTVHFRARNAFALLVAMAMVAQQAAAQSAPARVDPVRHVDLLVDYHDVSGGFGDWASLGMRLILPASEAPARTVWQIEGLWRRAFGDAGAYASVAVQQALGGDWLAHLAVGSGGGEFIFPDARVDISLSRKWLSRQQLLTTVGAGMVDAKQGYRDRSAFASVAWYVVPGLVIEGGARRNRSLPGAVTSTRAFGALTLGTERRRYVVLRGSAGDEGYQLIGPRAALVTFSSREAGISWREWLGRDWGAFVQGERYTNPHYDRTGMTGGVFVYW
jgi:YaiO family outer membrane protein